MATKMSDQAANLLLEAADDLEKMVMPKGAKWNMYNWGKHSKSHEPTEENYCGTSACAIGWLTTMPKWQERGIKGKWVPELKWNGEEHYVLYPSKAATSFGSNPTIAWHARAQRVFHINDSSSDFLFASLLGQNRQQFVEKVRDFVRLRRKGKSVLESAREIENKATCKEFG